MLAAEIGGDDTAMRRPGKAAKLAAPHVLAVDHHDLLHMKKLAGVGHHAPALLPVGREDVLQVSRHRQGFSQAPKVSSRWLLKKEPARCTWPTMQHWPIRS